MKLRKSGVLILLVSGLVWWGAYKSRADLIQLHCYTKPQDCVLENVFWLDRKLFVSEDESAHLLSFKTQNIAAAIGFGVPILLQTGLAIAGKVTPIVALGLVGVDLLLIAEGVALNGAVNEVAKVATQRPRPHVYKHPTVAGDNPHHYTSFYSGHTSFAAVVSMGLIFVLMGRGVSRRWIWLFGLSGAGLTLFTGYLRMIAGRHFFTDVVVGLISGMVFAYLIARLHFYKSRDQ